MTKFRAARFGAVRGSVSDLKIGACATDRSLVADAPRTGATNLWCRFLRGGLGCAFRRRRRYSHVVGYFFGPAVTSRLSGASFGAPVFGFASQGRLAASDSRRAACDSLRSGELVGDALLNIRV